jgi:hypothetical protein
MSVPLLGKPDEEQIRLLVCRTCKTVEELPDYDGDPADDWFLNEFVGKHQRPEPHIGLLLRFPFKYWIVPTIRAEILTQIQDGSQGLDVFGTQFYDTKMNFSMDAMTCYGQHNRPKGQCPDYKSDKKLLKPGTDKERKDAKLGKYGQTGKKVYLCDFCPVKSYNMQKHNLQSGLYN